MSRLIFFVFFAIFSRGLFSPLSSARYSVTDSCIVVNHVSAVSAFSDRTRERDRDRSPRPGRRNSARSCSFSFDQVPNACRRDRMAGALLPRPWRRTSRRDPRSRRFKDACETRSSEGLGTEMGLGPTS